MRPLRVEVEGFSAFRARTVVDFDDVELFAFIGPTGSGKSSILDAITFALYGKVARYQDDRIVAAVVNAQSAEAKVRLDFEVDGVPYSAVRVVRRQKNDRATTKEARLQRGDDVLAGDTRSLDASVESLLGLSFEQFTKTAVLPQGDFAAFLHAKPSDRQDVLVRLLDLGVYGVMASAARVRAKAAADHAAFLEQQVADGGAVSAADAVAARTRAVALRELGESLRDTLAEVDNVDRSLAEVAESGKQLQAHAALLRELRVPKVARTFESDRAKVAEVLGDAVAKLELARSMRDRAQEVIKNAPDVNALSELKRELNRLDKMEPLIASAEAALRAADADVRTSEAAFADVQLRVDEAHQHLEKARARAGAVAMRHELHEGEPCPVCEQLVSTVPELVPADEFEKARGAHAKLTARLTAAQTAHAKLITTLAKAESTLDHLVGERNELAATLEGAPSLVEVDAELERATLRQKALERAMETVKIGESAQSAAERAMKELAATERKLRAQFHSTRDALAALDPPSIGEAGVLADWQVLVEWGSTAGDHVEKELGELVTQRDSLRKRRVELVATVEDACARLGIDGTQPRVLEHLAVEATKCDAEADRVRETLARIQQLRTQADAKRAEQQVAEELGRLLGASGFQQWLLEEALDELVDGASARLEQLSSGQFSLERRERDFMVRDHRNADELRSVRTLSGGETFLASLSLALALADNVAALSAEGAPKLESIFLDEGFGTLDAETLEVVAAAIEELGASGRMVGIVTHIHELAERLPTRFEVSKGPSTSTVERVER